MKYVDMPGAEAVEMMRRCKHEIADQRRSIEVMAPKANAYDQLCKVLDLLPGRPLGYSEDLVSVLESRIEKMKVDVPPEVLV